MKSILISIKPKYVADILNGHKTIEIRKTCPVQLRGDTPVKPEPIDVYIYCTKDNSNGYLYYSFGKSLFHDKYVLIKEYDKRCVIGNGKVVAKFTLNKVEPIYIQDRFHSWSDEHDWELATKTLTENEICNKSCVDIEDIWDYLINGNGYAWHISNLEIFDRPKELSEFRQWFDCDKCWCDDNHSCLANKQCPKHRLTKAPQSWCYVEVQK